MLFVVVGCFALATSVSATAFTDMNCTNGDAAAPAFIASATACEDNYSSTTCTTIFEAAVAPLGTDDRNAKCLTDEDMKAFAIATCPKTCGYCCMTPEYNCKNKEFPRTKCETVTSAQCKDPSWRPILAEDCPSVCGLCLEGGCVDTVIECENDPTICRNVDMQDFVKDKCKKTCGYCDAASTTAAASAATTAPGGSSGGGTGNCPNAVDANSNCANWVKNGFCTNSFYTTEQRKIQLGNVKNRYDCNLTITQMEKDEQS
nr:Metridin ShK toxin domain containing protein [Haemonchus contortus]